MKLLAILTLAFTLLFTAAAVAAPTSTRTARIRTAALVSNAYGTPGVGLYVQVSRECPVVAPNTRLCYFYVPRSSPFHPDCGPFAPFAGYTRVRQEPGQIRTWMTKRYCVNA